MRKGKGRYSPAFPTPKYNNATGLYDVTEGEITFHLTFQQVNSLKKYGAMSHGYVPTVYGWYKDLLQPDRKEVKVEGLPENDTGFIADPDYPD